MAEHFGLFLSFNLDFGMDWRVFGFLLAVTTATGVAFEIIGVVRDIKGRNLFESPSPIFYVPVSQHQQPNVILHV